jgi:hypothetical protein
MTMAKKPKFKPLITRIELNPEQSVLSCPGYDTGYSGTASATQGWTVCFIDPKFVRPTCCAHSDWIPTSS